MSSEQQALRNGMNKSIRAQICAAVPLCLLGDLLYLAIQMLGFTSVLLLSKFPPSAR